MKTITVFFVSVLVSLSAHAATHEVKMLNTGKDGMMVFEPAFLQVKKGDKVKFVPTDTAHDAASVAVPKGAKGWSGKVNEAVTATLTEEGVYLYECKSHITMAMVGVIQVGSNTSNLEDVKKAAGGLNAKFVMNKDRLDKLIAQVKK